ncbi:CHAT domain-containing protein [Microbacterium allomyrinae]|uniref:CHAT domain-containing protein n=1 Tax=Microbacterium allomyrinae TaxID=2830666 RepID=A0A9X1S4N9_9MICO|nr:CHAT domain-containing protein [Microbacterium allomyrinae]MCC2033687.1 CHAT domain-containing protein [Microbacterium allomyrinae]
MTTSAQALHRRGVDAANRRRYPQALRLLQDAALRSDAPDLGARIAGTTAFVMSQMGDATGAEALCRETLGRGGISRETLAILYGQLGALAEHGGRLDEAREMLGRAIRSVEADSLVAARMFVNRSVVNMHLRRLASAAADAEAAARVYALRNMDFDEAQAKHNLGYIALLRGDLVTALREMLDARATLASASEVAAAICDVDRAQVLRDAGLVTEAEALLAHAATTFGRRHMPHASGEARFQLARSLLAHSASESAKMAGRSSRTFARLGNETWEVRAEALRLRALLDHGRSSGQVVEPGRRRWAGAAEIEDVAERLTTRGFRMEAAALRLTFELAQVRDGSTLAPRTRVPRSAPLELRLLDEEVRAARATAAGRHATARRQLATGLDTLASWQESGSIDLQSAIQMHGGSLVYSGIESAVRSGRADVIFAWSERARHLSQQVVPLRPPPDPSVAQDVAELRALRTEAASEDWLSEPRTAALRERVRQRQWSSTGAAAVEQRIDLEEFQATLPHDATLIAFVFTGAVLSSVVIRPNGATVVPLPPVGEVRRALAGLRSDLDMSATIRNSPIADVVRRSLDERLAVLAELLIAEPLRVAGAERVILTVPGILREVPWGMLPGLRERPFTLAVSATRWARFARTPRPTPTRAGFVAGPRVARGVEELARASAPWCAPVVEHGAGASARRLTEIASRVNVLHVAAHGRHAADNPMFSGLELADGTLFGYDIDLIRDMPDAVVLSACEVGRSSIRWGEEAIGMTRVWLHAGVRSVVAAPVAVADDDACELLSVMHEGLAAGVSPSEALAAASERTGIVAPFQVHGAGF